MTEERQPIALRLVEDLNWRQGVLLPVLSWSTLFLNTDPVTDLSKQVMKADSIQQAAAPPIIRPHWIATGLPAGKLTKQQYVVASQTCDIAKRAEDEPFVVVMRAFKTDNVRIRSTALRYSARQFVLNPATGLVVDASVQALVEKPLLATFSPEESGASREFERRFSHWLGRRYSRAAHPDSFVASVSVPIRDILRDLERSGDKDFDVLSDVSEIRIGTPAQRPPFEVRLFFILDPHMLSKQGLKIRLSALASKIRSAILDKDVAWAGWGAYSLENLPARIYQDTDQMLFDEFSFSTGELVGEMPSGPD